MLLRNLFYLVLGLFLFGCVSVTPTPEVESLSPVQNGRSFELLETVTVTKAFQWQLVPGKYVAELSNELGTIYRGPKYAVLQEIQASPSAW